MRASAEVRWLAFAVMAVVGLLCLARFVRGSGFVDVGWLWLSLCGV